MSQVDNTVFFDSYPYPKANNARPSRAERRQARKTLKQSRQFDRQPQRLSPKNATQSEYMDFIREEDFVFGIGPAGVGKTYIAARMAIEMLDDGQFEKIVVTRPTVGVSNENIGFLPGSKDEKVAAWAIPIYDAMVDSLGSKEKLDAKIKKGEIEFAPFQFMRGRTFSSAFILADESQNLTIEQFRVLVTRVGEGSKIIITGDLRQSDLRGVNGLKYGVQLAERYNLSCATFEFESSDVVRSGIAAEWVRAFEDEED